jgi:hypothetical protein
MPVFHLPISVVRHSIFPEVMLCYAASLVPLKVFVPEISTTF